MICNQCSQPINIKQDIALMRRLFAGGGTAALAASEIETLFS